MGCSGTKEKIEFTRILAPEDYDTKNKIKVIFLIGGPGSGKGTQCKKMTEAYECIQISTGELLRNVVSEGKNPKSEEIKKVQSEGGFVSSNLLLDVVAPKLFELRDQVILFDGFPRNKENMEAWKKKGLEEYFDVIATIYYECSPETMTERILGRNQGRNDDNQEGAKKRIENFNKETVPIIDTLPNVKKINAEGEKEAITEETFKFLDELQIKKKE